MGEAYDRVRADRSGALSAPFPGQPDRQTFMMATGIECSYPTVQGGRRRDELDSTDHYRRWAEDFELCRDIGARYVRYGLPYYRMHLGPGRYDWSFADEVLPAMWDKGLIPIADLCHFGVPDWVGSFQNRDWPPLFAEYAGAFAERYPWIKFFTPVNEVLVCSRFSALYGLWNEQEKSDRAFVTAHTVQCQAMLLAIGEILKRRPDAVFIQSEIAETFLDQSPAVRQAARFRNHLRFLTFDNLYGRAPEGDVLNYLYDNGFTRQEFDWFIRNGRSAAGYCVMGMDYYGMNEKLLQPDGEELSGAVLGWAAIAQSYFRRYRRPMRLTETNTIQHGDDHVGLDWLRRTWHHARFLRDEGRPVVGYTWYSLVDQIDWGIQLREIRNEVTPNGLFTLDRKPRPIAHAYKMLAEGYGGSAVIRAMPAGFERSWSDHGVPSAA